MKDRLTSRRTPSCWRAFWIGLTCLFLLCRHNSAQAQQGAYRLQSAQGRVEIQAGGEGPWVAVRRGVRVAAPADHIRTGPNGSVYIVRDGGQRIALGPNTEVVLREPDKPRAWRLVLGRLLAFLSGHQRLEVRAPSAIAAAEGTVFQLDASEDGTTVLTVVEGRVEFFNDMGSVNVLDSQQSTAVPGAAPTRPVIVDPSSLIAWEANLQTLIIELEYPQVSTDPDELQQELARQQQALQERPEDAEARVALTRVLLDLGRTEEAEAQARQAAELAAADGAGLLGYALLQAGRPAEARQQFSLADEAQPDNARWQLGLALTALGQRRSGPAVALLQRAAELAPTDPVPPAYLAAAHLRSGDLEAADAAASEALRLGPDHHLANIYVAYVRLAQGKLDEAVSAGTRAVQAAPRSALAHEALATAHFFAGNFSEARDELNEALELNPLSGSSHLTLAKLSAAEDDIDDALEEAQTAVALNPQSAPARSTLGLLCLLNNDPQRAGRAFKTALALEPSLSEARTGWGAVLARRGRFQEALGQQKAAVSLDTGSASAHNNLGGVYAALGHMQPAMDQLGRAIELQPEWGLPYANLALVHLEQNRFREALDAAERGVELGERSAFLHTVLARIYRSQGRSDRALAELRQAVALDEHYPQAHFQLAQLYLEQDRARDAVREILTSVSTDPSAMLETRRYARTENTAAGGRFDRFHYDARHSNTASEGQVSYFASGLIEDTGGFRALNQDHAQKFVEVISGHQSRPTQQLVFLGTFFDRTAGLPGPVTTASKGDPDDRQAFTGYEGVVAYRQRLSPKLTATAKYSFRRDLLRVRNADSLSGADTNAFRELVNARSQHSPEIRLDANISETYSLRMGLSGLWNHRDRHGTVGTFDPGAGQLLFGPFSTSDTPRTTTGWFEAQGRFSDRFHLLAGGYWGRQTGSSAVLLPKVVALYRPDSATWLSFVANPIFRSDAAELAPVEALADPVRLGFLNFVEGGAARSYELRYQRLASRSSTITTSLSYQRVRGLLIDVQDPGLTALPSRVLTDRGHRWIAEAAYEQWLTDTVTGRAFVRWQDSRGRFPQAQVSGKEWPYTPNWQVGGRLDYIDGTGLRIGLDTIWVGRRFHDPQNTQRVGDYPLVNLRVQYQRNLHQNCFINLTNLTGRGYETFAGFPQPGRAIFTGVEYRY